MSQNKQRRSFFKYLISGSAALATVSLSSKSVASEDSQGQLVDHTTKSTGYHETEHIRDYYEKINF